VVVKPASVNAALAAKSLLNLFIITSLAYYVGNFGKILVFRPIVDPRVRRSSDSPRRVKKLQEMHETPTYRPIGLICQRDERYEGRIPQRWAICTIFQ